MIRNLKVLALALTAAFALSAVAASAALAQNGTLTSDGPVTLIGIQTGVSSSNVWSMFGATTECSSTLYTYHKYEETPHKFISNGATTFTVTPHYGACIIRVGGSSFATTIDMNGCDFALHLEGTKLGGTDEYLTKTTIVCPAGQHITKTIYASAAKHASHEPFCHLTITENAAGYAGFIAKDTTNGKIDISGKIEGISADKKSPTGSILCPEEATAAGSMSEDVTLEGRNEMGVATSISLSHL